MQITISVNQADLLRKRQGLAAQALQAVTSAQQQAQLAQEVVADVVNAIALDNGAKPGARFEQFTLSREGEKDVLTLTEALQPTQSTAG